LVGDVETADANLTYHIVSGPSAAQGTLIVSSTGVYSFTPAANFNGSFDITYNADDRGDPDNCGAVSTSCAASKTSDTKKVTITVTPVNDPPKAYNDSASVVEDDATGVLVDVKANDNTGPANESAQTLTITAVTQGTHGSVAIESGKVRYIPTDTNYNGSDSFTYTIRDNGQSGSPLADDFKFDTGTVTITVTPVNDKPVATDGSASGAEDGSPISVDLTALVGDVETADAESDLPHRFRSVGGAGDADREQHGCLQLHAGCQLQRLFRHHL